MRVRMCCCIGRSRWLERGGRDGGSREVEGKWRGKGIEQGRNDLECVRFLCCMMLQAP